VIKSAILLKHPIKHPIQKSEVHLGVIRALARISGSLISAIELHREFSKELVRRLSQPPLFIQAIIGPRQNRRGNANRRPSQADIRNALS
jgi:hypothetical protein